MNRLAEEAAYFGAVEDGARSRDDEIERLQKQIMILREALGQLSLYVAHNGDDWVKIQALATIPSKESEMSDDLIQPTTVRPKPRIGDILNAQQDEIERMREELVEAQKWNVLLREAIDRQPYTMDKQVCEALAATQDLSGLVLCDAEPFGIVAHDYGTGFCIDCVGIVKSGEVLYRAKTS